MFMTLQNTTQSWLPSHCAQESEAALGVAEQAAQAVSAEVTELHQVWGVGM